MAYKRKKYYDRSQIGYDVKQRVLEKSNCLCSRCGKPISLVDKTFTLEHVVPLSQGGTNDEDNLIGLCLDCNKEKGELVITQDLDKYYKYLNPEGLEGVLNYIKWYKESFSTIDFNTWLPSDLMEVRLGKTNSPISQMVRKNKVKGHQKQFLLACNSVCILKKAMYEDMESVFNFYKSLDYTGHISVEELEEDLKYAFLVGSVYALYNSSKEIIGCFNVSLSMANNVFKDGEIIVPEIGDLACKKSAELHLMEGIYLMFVEILKVSGLDVCMSMLSVASKPKNMTLINLLALTSFVEYARGYRDTENGFTTRQGGDIGFCTFYTSTYDYSKRIMHYANTPIIPKLDIKDEDSDLKVLGDKQNAFLGQVWDDRISFLKSTLSFPLLDSEMIKALLTSSEKMQAIRNANDFARGLL